MTTTSDKLDINFVDGEYSIYHSQLKRKGHRTNIRANNINNKYNTFSGRDAESELCYGRTTAHREKCPSDNPLCLLLIPDDQFCIYRANRSSSNLRFLWRDYKDRSFVVYSDYKRTNFHSFVQKFPSTSIKISSRKLNSYSRLSKKNHSTIRVTRGIIVPTMSQAWNKLPRNGA